MDAERVADDVFLENLAIWNEAERAWLKSIKAPCARIPENVVSAIVLRWLHTIFPADVRRELVDAVMARAMLKEALNGNG